MKILIVVDSFFKKAHVTPFRTRLFNEYLKKAGYETFVLTSKIDKNDHNENFEPEAVNRAYFYNRPIIFLFTEPIKIVFSKFLKIFGIEVKRDIIRQIFFIPDVYAWTIPWRTLQVLYVCLKEKIDIVFISASPYSIAFSGYLAKLILRKPIVLELRDLWDSEDPLFRKRIWLYRKIFDLQHKFVLAYISRLIVVTRGAENFYKSRFPKIRVDYIPSAPHPAIKCEEYKKPRQFNILICGRSFLDTREPALLFAALSKARIPITVQFVSEGQWYIDYLKKRFDLPENVQIERLKPIPMADLGQYISNASILYFAQNKDFKNADKNTAISSNTYHYIASGRFILADIPPGDNLDILKNYCNNFCAVLSDDPKEILGIVRNIYGKWEMGENIVLPPKEKYSCDYNWGSSSERLINIFGKVLKYEN